MRVRAIQGSREDTHAWKAAESHRILPGCIMALTWNSKSSIPVESTLERVPALDLSISSHWKWKQNFVYRNHLRLIYVRWVGEILVPLLRNSPRVPSLRTGEHKSWDSVSLLPYSRKLERKSPFFNQIHYASLMPNVILSTLLGHHLILTASLSTRYYHLHLFRLRTQGSERLYNLPQLSQLLRGKIQGEKVGPSESKAPLPTSSDAQLGQKVETQHLWEDLGTSKTMLS